MKTNEQLLEDWYESIITNKETYMLDAAGDDNHFTGNCCGDNWDLDFTVDNSNVHYDHGDYWNPPYVYGKVYISGILKVYRPDDDEVIREKDFIRIIEL